MKLFRRMSGFVLIPILSSLTPFLILPLLSALPSAWLAVALGQSVGAFGALVVGLGLSTVGPTLIAQAAIEDRPKLYERGTRARLLASLPTVFAMAIVVWWVGEEGSRLLALLMALAAVLSGLSPNWYLIGEGKPFSLLLYDALPRAGATGISGLFISFGAPPEIYPLLLLTSAIFCNAAFCWKNASIRRLLFHGWGDSLRFAFIHRAAAAAEVVSGVYTTLSVTLVSVGASTHQSSIYVSGDKLVRLGQAAISAQSNGLQGWVSEGGSGAHPRRFRVSLMLHSLIGLVLGLMVYLLGPWATRFIFSDFVSIDSAVAACLGGALFLISITSSVGRHYLVPLGMTGAVFTATVAGAVMGVPLALTLSASLGALGGSLAFVCAELTVLIALLVGVLRSRRKLEHM